MPLYHGDCLALAEKELTMITSRDANVDVGATAPAGAQPNSHANGSIVPGEAPVAQIYRIGGPTLAAIVERLAGQAAGRGLNGASIPAFGPADRARLAVVAESSETLEQKLSLAGSLLDQPSARRCDRSAQPVARPDRRSHFGVRVRRPIPSRPRLE
jgi:hypothetical protein